MINLGPVGPGFFIFFQQTTDALGGGGYPGNPIIFVHKREEEQTKKKIRKKVKVLRKKIKHIPSQELIQKVTEALLDTYKPEKAAEKYDFSLEVATRRYEDYIKWYIQFIEDEEIALILIFANI